MKRTEQSGSSTFGDEVFSPGAVAAGWGWEDAQTLDEADWARRCRERGSPRWGNYSWLTPKILLESANDVIAKRFDDIVPFRRQRWLAQQRAAGVLQRFPDLVIPWTGRAEPKVALLGDPGEADQSQYAVVQPLLATCGDTDFMVVLSDVIYPAGDINDYVDGFLRPNLEYERPIFAIPGNHDWYDGLTGFMFHFCGAEPLPPVTYRTSGQTLGQRLAASLWRDPRAPLRATLLRHRRTPVPLQPAPYFAIETESLLYVAIDTGITGTLDREQGEWLIDVSARIPKDKVLLTGKPIYVSGRYRPCPILWNDPGQQRQIPVPYEDVDAVVREPAHRYVAVIGGDTHNYQRSEVDVHTAAGTRRIRHIVAGGGGAFLSATHTIPNEDRFETHPADQVKEFHCFPTRGDSLALFTRRFGRGLLFVIWVATGAAGLAAALLAALSALGGVDVPGARADAGALELAAAGVAAVAVVAVSAALGWAGALALLAVLSRVIPADEERWPTKQYRGVTAAALMLVVVAGTVALLDVVVSDDTWRWAWAPTAAAVLLVVGIPGAILYSYLSRRGAAGLVRRFVPRLAAVVAVLGPVAWVTGVGLSAAIIGGALLIVAVAAPGAGMLRERRPHVATGLLRTLLALGGIALVVVSFAIPWWPGQVVLSVLAGLVLVLWAALIAVSRRALRVLGGLRRCRLDPDVAVRYVTDTLELPEPERAVGAAPVGTVDERLCDILMPPPGRKRLFNAIVSEAAEATSPPFFKQFLELEVDGGDLVVRCHGVSGWVSEATAPVEQDSVRIPITATAAA